MNLKQQLAYGRLLRIKKRIDARPMIANKSNYLKVVINYVAAGKIVFIDNVNLNKQGINKLSITPHIRAIIDCTDLKGLGSLVVTLQHGDHLMCPEIYSPVPNLEWRYFVCDGEYLAITLTEQGRYNE